MKYYTIAAQSNKNGKMCYLCHDIIYDYDLSYNVHDSVPFDSEAKARCCHNELKKNKDNEHRRNFMAFLYGNYSNYQIVKVETTIHKVIDLEV